jgi:hypothetical protein
MIHLADIQLYDKNVPPTKSFPSACISLYVATPSSQAPEE